MKHILITALVLACACAAPIDWSAECDRRGEHDAITGESYDGCIHIGVPGFHLVHTQTYRACKKWIKLWRSGGSVAVDYCNRGNVAVREW